LGKYSNIIEGMRRILRLAERPQKQEFMNMLKLIYAGLFLTGAIAFAVQMAITLTLIYTGHAP